MSASIFPYDRGDQSGPDGRRSIPIWRAGLGLGLFLICSFVLAGDIELNPSHPERYTVVAGDTLWDIAGKFLKQPWQWPEVWRENRQIENPNLIYPGDVLRLTQSEGRPVLQVETPSELRLSPKIRFSPTAAAIPTIPMNAIRQFLTRPRVVSADEIANAPYVVALADEHIVGGAGNRIFVRSILRDTGNAYTVFRPGQPYQDAESGEILGYEALFLADTQLQEFGDPATLLLSGSEKEVRIGDRLLPAEQEATQVSFQPRAPRGQIRGHIINVVGGVSQIGQYSVVALDRGTADGIEIGHVLAIWQSGKVIRDVIGPSYGESIATPEQRTGLLMVFRSFDRVSYGLVMETTRALHVFDVVITP